MAPQMTFSVCCISKIYWALKFCKFFVVVLSRQLRRRRRGRGDSGWQNRRPEHRCSGSLGLHNKINNKYNAKQMSLKIDLFFYFSNVQTELIFLRQKLLAGPWQINDLETEGKAAYLLNLLTILLPFLLFILW
jgi:hypothetical protein